MGQNVKIGNVSSNLPQLKTMNDRENENCNVKSGSLIITGKQILF